MLVLLLEMAAGDIRILTDATPLLFRLSSPIKSSAEVPVSHILNLMVLVFCCDICTWMPLRTLPL